LCWVKSQWSNKPTKSQLPELLDPLPLKGAVVTADALHTQQNTARYVVETKQADYLFIVKDNQATLRQDIAELNLSLFPLSTPPSIKPTADWSSVTSGPAPSSTTI